MKRRLNAAISLRLVSMKLPLRTIFFSTVLFSWGCHGSTAGLPPIHEWVVEEGRPVRSFLDARGDTSVVLVYAPSDCFSCDGELARWTAISRDRGWRVQLFLTAAPSPGERDQLRLFRLQPAGVLDGDAARTGLSTPRVYRFAGQTLVDSAVGKASEHALLGRAAGGDPTSEATRRHP
jgi:hypothetical protein